MKVVIISEDRLKKIVEGWKDMNAASLRKALLISAVETKYTEKELRDIASDT